MKGEFVRLVERPCGGSWWTSPEHRDLGSGGCCQLTLGSPRSPTSPAQAGRPGHRSPPAGLCPSGPGGRCSLHYGHKHAFREIWAAATLNNPILPRIPSSFSSRKFLSTKAIFSGRDKAGQAGPPWEGPARKPGRERELKSSARP